MQHPPSLTPPLINYAPPQEPYLDVLFADEHILVVDKPEGLLAVPGKAEEHWDCLEYRAKQRFDDARIVHRLDMDTSGLMVMALNAQSHRNLGRQFEKRKIKKNYIARVWGHPDAQKGRVELPLKCDWPNRPKQKVCFDEGRAAVTDWQILDQDEISSRILLEPLTGRSHQLRVHMLALGHVILGDRFYAAGEALEACSRLALHAQRLELIHPALGEWMTFESECPF